MSCLVTVIIPNFNRGQVARQAVGSVLTQEEADFELIVVDDASTAPPLALYEMVEKAGHRVLRLSTNTGPGAARNAAVKLARGSWLAFLDSDDYWLPNKLSLHLKSLQDSGCSIGQTLETWYRNGREVTPPKAHRIEGGDLFRRSLKAVCVSSSTVVLKRDLFVQHGGFDETLFVCEDYDLWLRISVQERFDYLPQPLVMKYGGHDDQLSQALPAMDRFRIISILKGLQDRTFTGITEDGADRFVLAVTELERKLRILTKGSGKRGMVEVVKQGQELQELISAQNFTLALQRAKALALHWPIRP